MGITSNRNDLAPCTFHIPLHFLNAHALRILIQVPYLPLIHVRIVHLHMSMRTTQLCCNEYMMLSGKDWSKKYKNVLNSYSSFITVRAKGRGRKQNFRFNKELLVDYVVANGLPPTRASAEEGGYWCGVAEYVCSSAVRKPYRSLVRAVAGAWYSNTHGVKDACLLALGHSTATSKTSVSTTIHHTLFFFMKFNSKQRAKQVYKMVTKSRYGAWGDIIKDEVNSSWNMYSFTM